MTRRQDKELDAPGTARSMSLSEGFKTVLALARVGAEIEAKRPGGRGPKNTDAIALLEALGVGSFNLKI